MSLDPFDDSLASPQQLGAITGAGATVSGTGSTKLDIDPVDYYRVTTDSSVGSLAFSFQMTTELSGLDRYVQFITLIPISGFVDDATINYAVGSGEFDVDLIGGDFTGGLGTTTPIELDIVDGAEVVFSLSGGGYDYDNGMTIDLSGLPNMPDIPGLPSTVQTIPNIVAIDFNLSVAAGMTGGSGTDGSGTDGSGTDGSGTDGSGTDSSGTDGSGTDGSGTDGSGTDGSGTDGSGTDGSGTGGSGSGSGSVFDLVDALTATALANLVDFDGNMLGAADAWSEIGRVDVQGDGDVEVIMMNETLGRWATLGITAEGTIDFSSNGDGGDTRVVGVYIDPLVADGTNVLGGPFDSQTRFANDISSGNLGSILGADDYDGDGFQEVYFGLDDGTAVLHAYMHADGNIRYANYQSEADLDAFMQANGIASSVYDSWF